MRGENLAFIIEEKAITIEMTHSTVQPREEAVAEDTEPEDVLQDTAPIMAIAPNLDEAHRSAAERNQIDFMTRMKQRIAETAACRCIDRTSTSN